MGFWSSSLAPSRGGPASKFLEIDSVSATRSNWLWTSDPSITTPIAFTGVKHNDGGVDGTYVVGTDGEAPTLLPTADTILDGYPSWFPDGSALTVEGRRVVSTRRLST